MKDSCSKITDIAGATNIVKQAGDIESKMVNPWVSHV